MSWLAPKLQLKAPQRQILPPGLVQMVSLLQLNKLELREIIEQELMQNPVLEEVAEDGLPREPEAGEREAAEEGFERAEREVPPEETKDPFEDFDMKAVFEEYMDATDRQGEREENERPAFENFLSPPGTLTEHLEWQLGLAMASDEVKAAVRDIIGNLNEDGYLTATLEEIASSGGGGSGQHTHAAHPRPRVERGG